MSSAAALKGALEELQSRNKIAEEALRSLILCPSAASRNTSLSRLLGAAEHLSATRILVAQVPCEAGHVHPHLLTPPPPTPPSQFRALPVSSWYERMQRIPFYTHPAFNWGAAPWQPAQLVLHSPSDHPNAANTRRALTSQLSCAASTNTPAGTPQQVLCQHPTMLGVGERLHCRGAQPAACCAAAHQAIDRC